MQNMPLEKSIKRRNRVLGLVLALVVLVLVGLAINWVSPEFASGTNSILSGMR